MIRRHTLFPVFLVVALGLWASLNLPPLNAAGTPVRTTLDGNQHPEIKFSHKLHVESAGMQCVDCHTTAPTSKVSSDLLAAGHDNCNSCHEEQLTSACGYCHTKPDDIVPVVAPVREILFSHEQHLAMKGVECQTCHPGVDQTEMLSGVKMPAMERCSACHNDRQASNTCESCHRNLVLLVPSDHRQSGFLRNHRERVRLGEFEASCQMCHAETYCQECHQGVGLKAFGPGELMSDPAPRVSGKDSPNRIRLQNVHELGYRFTHGIDAKSRRSECASCHSAQEFCVQCHEAGGNINQAGFKPASHSVPGFAGVGRGTGGGLHAEEARRDMESCISCHDVEGRDPTCLTCHTEGGGVR